MLGCVAMRSVNNRGPSVIARYASVWGSTSGIRCGSPELEGRSVRGLFPNQRALGQPPRIVRITPWGAGAATGDHGDMSQVASAQVGVLVVDDQDPYRRAMSAVVDETEGFAVVGAVASGEESVAAATELRPDLVLMDVNLPGIDGIQAAREIRAVASAPVVVLLSTYDEDDFDLSGCGAAAYISKSALSSARLLEVWSNRHELRAPEQPPEA